MNPKESEQQKKLDDLRTSLSKTISGFKNSVLSGIKSVESQGPLQEALRRDASNTDAVPVQAPQPEPEMLPLIKPLDGVQTGIIQGSQVQQWVEDSLGSQQDARHYVDVNTKTPLTKIRMAGVHAFCSGIDNEIHSKARTFLQKMGVRTHIPSGKGFGRYSVIEQFNTYKDFNFAIVVLTADCYVVQKSQSTLEHALFITDQATVFELGFLIGRLGRNHVAVLYQVNDRFKRPTEYFDVLYTPYDEGGQWQEKILRQMRSCGFDIHEEQIAAS